jgi:hypothetical protein
MYLLHHLFRKVSLLFQHASTLQYVVQQIYEHIFL